MTINLKMPDITELKPRITVFGVGGAGGNAVNNMITAGLQGVDFVCANTDAQALATSKSERIIQMGVAVTEGLGAGSHPEVGRAAAEEVIDEIRDHLSGAHMVFITAGMGGGTGTGAAPVIARAARELGILTVGVVTKPFQFEGQRRMRVADAGITELQKSVDTLIVIPNQNLFRVANERTTFADAFAMADQVLYSGVACITDLMVKEGLINLDFADVRAVMREMGKAMMGTGEASGERRAILAAEAAIANPLLDETSMKGARGLLISITGGKDLTLYEVDEAATRIREEVDEEANIILGATFDDSLDGIIRVSVVATGIDVVLPSRSAVPQADERSAEAAPRWAARAEPAQAPQAARTAAGSRELPAAQAESQAAVAQTGGITIRPFQPSPSLVHEHEPAAAPRATHGEEMAQEPFIPPVPERAEPRAPRMPRLEDFPPVVQPQVQQVLAREPEAQEQGGFSDRKRLGLLRRLASVGLGLRDEEIAPAPAPAPQPEPVRQEPPAVSARETPSRETPDFAKRPQPSHAGQGLYRPRQGDLDPHGRPQPARATHEDDHLEIPAFLRRQSS